MQNLNTRRNVAARAAIALALLVAPISGFAAIIAVNLDIFAPTNNVGPYVTTDFALGPQNSIVDGTTVASIPAPLGGDLAFGAGTIKFSVPDTWFTWSHGYTGAVFRSASGTSAGTATTMTLPPNVVAFRFFYEGLFLDASTVTITTNDGGTIGPITVTGTSGAKGIAFYSDTGLEHISTVTITSDDPAFAVAEFALSNGSLNPTFVSPLPVPSLSQWALVLVALLTAAVGMRAISRRI